MLASFGEVVDCGQDLNAKAVFEWDVGGGRRPLEECLDDAGVHCHGDLKVGRLLLVHESFRLEIKDGNRRKDRDHT